MTHLQKTLLILAFIQVLAAVGLHLDPSDTAPAPANTLLGLKPSDVTELKITKPAQDQTAEQSLVLSRKDSDWVLPSADNFAVDSQKVDEVIEKLTNLTVENPIASSAVNHNTLKVGVREYSKRVTIKTATESVELVIGDAKGRSMYLRRKDSADVYLANGITAFDVGHEVTHYTDPEYFSVSDLKEVIIERPNVARYSTVRLYQDSGGLWTVEGLEDKTLEQSRVRALLSAVRSARMVRPVGKSLRPEFGLGNPKVKVTVGGENKTVEFILGNITDDFIYMKASDKEDVVMVRKYTVESLFTLDPTRLIDPKANSAAEPGLNMPAPPSLTPMQQ
ncbi:MAG: DUF4340 domain-containing protein [Bradymonadia bacterium]